MSKDPLHSLINQALHAKGCATVDELVSWIEQKLPEGLQAAEREALKEEVTAALQAMPNILNRSYPTEKRDLVHSDEFFRKLVRAGETQPVLFREVIGPLFEALLEAAKENSGRQQEGLTLMEQLWETLRPVMDNHPGRTVEEALEILRERAKAAPPTA